MAQPMLGELGLIEVGTTGLYEFRRKPKLLFLMKFFYMLYWSFANGDRSQIRTLYPLNELRMTRLSWAGI